MADFQLAFEKMIQHEGGYKLTSVHEDRGGQTYAGIARNSHPNWSGWKYIDAKDLRNQALSSLVGEFYKVQFWQKTSGDKITRQAIAEALFDFGVNVGVSTAIKLAQQVVGTAQDGSIGPITLGKQNTIDEEYFIVKYALAKVRCYAEICNRDRSQSKFLLGWINRTLKGLS